MDHIDLGILIMRLAFGLSLAYHGLNKVIGAGGLAGTSGWFGSLGMKSPMLQARLAATTEILSGLFFACGLLTPFAAGAMVALMIVAIVTVHARVGYFIFCLMGVGNIVRLSHSCRPALHQLVLALHRLTTP